jgi:hypothetical protein
MSSPTSRSKAYLLKRHGGLVGITEKWNAFAKIRQDLFGFIDILAVNRHGTIGVQTTTGSNMQARIAKIQGEHRDDLVILFDVGWFIHVHGWSKSKKTGRWYLREFDMESGLEKRIDDP